MRDKELDAIKGQIVEREIALFAEKTAGELEDLPHKKFFSFTHLLKIRQHLPNKANA